MLNRNQMYVLLCCKVVWRLPKREPKGMLIVNTGSKLSELEEY